MRGRLTERAVHNRSWASGLVAALLAATASSDLRIKRLAQALSKPSLFVLYLGLIRAGVSQLVIIVRFSLLALLLVSLLGRSGLRQF